MNKDFKRFQRKYYYEFLLKDGFISLSVSFFAACILLLLKIIKVLQMGTWFYIVVPSVIFVVMFTAGGLIFKPDKKKISRRIDKELHLNQKVETMVNYENQSGMMIELQREDTSSILSKAETKSFKIRISPVLIGVLVVATLSFSSSVGVSIRKSKMNNIPGQSEKVLTEKTKDYISKVEAVITVINQSSMNEDIKSAYIVELNSLIDKMKNDGSDSYGGYALECIDAVKKDLSRYNSNDDIYSAFLKSENNSFVELGTALKALNIESIKSELTTVMNSLKGLNTSNLVKYVILQLKAIDASEIPEGDALYHYFETLKEKLEEIPVADDIDSSSQIEEAFDIQSSELRVSVLTERLNSNMASYIEGELRKIFSLPEDSETETPDEENKEDEEETSDKSSEEEEDEEDKNQDKGGGAGTGEVIYGSDDELFDPENGTVKYGDVISTYFADIFTQINETEDEEEKAKLMELFNYYYGILYGNNEESEGE